MSLSNSVLLKLLVLSASTYGTSDMDQAMRIGINASVPDLSLDMGQVTVAWPARRPRRS
ncbi:hypothetical protein TrVFT333_000691 [Trichoderma virens FT-333]|nr:hypothetical protein TrVFT333_000691 [Trichoderma virens FT-333]